MNRAADHPIDPLFLERASRRAMSGEPVDEPTLRQLFEAARWAPSSSNLQPWRFVFARAGTKAFPALLDLLSEGNRIWCRRAGALILVAAKRTNAEGAPAPSHLFDAGAAWMSLALQATRLGLVVHAMGGFDHLRAREELGVPEDHAIAALVALGHPGAVHELPEPLRLREAPSGRRAQSSFVFEGRFAATSPESASPRP